MPTFAENYNTKIIQIWKTHSRSLRGLSGARRFPLLIPETAKTVRLVYTGINPSFKLTAASKFARAAGCPMNYLRWGHHLSAAEIIKRVPRLQRFELIARKKYKRYFQPFERLSRDIGLSHKNTTHLDVLAIRTRDQAKLLNDLDKLRHRRGVQLFIKAQMSLYAEVLKGLSPEIVLVANAQASRWLREHLELAPSADKRTYRWPALPGTRFILSGQLGYGVTDEFSRDRLVADLKVVLDAGT